MIEVVSKQALEEVASMKPSKLTPGRDFADTHSAFDPRQWIEEHEVPIRHEGSWGEGYRWILKECPWNGHTDRSAYIVKLPNGVPAAGCKHNSCQGKRWQDLREHYEPGCYDYLNGSGETSYGNWASSRSDGHRNSLLPSVLPFPVEVLPPSLRLYVKEAAASQGGPPEFIAIPTLVTVGSAIGNSYALEVKKGWIESAVLYAAIVGDPGSKKSPALKAATTPAWDKQNQYVHEYRESRAAYLQAQRNEDLTVDPSDEPVMRRSVVSDTTVEALSGLLAKNTRGLLCTKDELSGWMRSLDQYKGGKGSDRQFYLSVWSNSPDAVDRKGNDEPQILIRPFVGMIGGIQPGILPEIKNDREDGLLDRFLFAYPDPTPTRWTDTEISDRAMAAYKGIYDELIGLETYTDQNGNPDPILVTFTVSAKQIFVDAYNSLHEEMAQPGFPEHLKGPWLKMITYIARLSLIIGMANMVEARNQAEGLYEFLKDGFMVGKRDVEAAVALVHYFKSHTYRVHAKLSGSKKPSATSRKQETEKTGDIVSTLMAFVMGKDGYWEGMTSELYEILKSLDVSGLPGGAGPFGKLVRRIAGQGDNPLVLGEGYSGNNPIIKLSTTLDTLGDASKPGTESTESTEGKNITQSNAETSITHSELQVSEAIKQLFQEHPETADDMPPDLVAVEVFYWGYLDFLPDESEVERILNDLAAI